MAPKTKEELAQALGIRPAMLRRVERMYQMEHGADAEVKLLRWLRVTYEQTRDRVRLMGKQTGYVESWAGSLQCQGVEGEGELESVPATYQDAITLEARTRRALDVERLAEQNRAQLRSFNEAMRDKIRKGQDITPHLSAAQKGTA